MIKTDQNTQPVHKKKTLRVATTIWGLTGLWKHSFCTPYCSDSIDLKTSCTFLSQVYIDEALALNTLYLVLSTKVFCWTLPWSGLCTHYDSFVCMLSQEPIALPKRWYFETFFSQDEALNEYIWTMCPSNKTSFGHVYITCILCCLKQCEGL